MRANIKIETETFKDPDSDFIQEFIRVETEKPYDEDKEYPRSVEGKIFDTREEAQFWLSDYIGDLLKMKTKLNDSEYLKDDAQMDLEAHEPLGILKKILRILDDVEFDSETEEIIAPLMAEAEIILNKETELLKKLAEKAIAFSKMEEIKKWQKLYPTKEDEPFAFGDDLDWAIRETKILP